MKYVMIIYHLKSITYLHLDITKFEISIEIRNSMVLAMQTHTIKSVVLIVTKLINHA